MRSLSFIALAAFVSAAAAAGCGATEPVDPAGDTEMTFLLNGEPWTANTPTEAILTAYGLVVFADLRFDDRFPLRQGVGFSVPLSEWDGAGTYPTAFRFVDGTAYSGYVSESDGDAGIARYRPVGEAAERGGFEVTAYDEATVDIEGRFEGVFAVDPGDARVSRRELPDTLWVTEGRFRAVVEDRR